MNAIRHQLLLMLLLGACALACAADRINEYQVKAAYIYKFSSYVEWPPTVFAQASTPLVIGILGADELMDELQRLVSPSVPNSRPIEYRRMKIGEAISGVQILFIGRRESERIKSVSESLQSQPVLVISEMPGALAEGSMINFVSVADYIRFEVSVTQAERVNLKISARLLAVAQKIESRKP